MEFDNNQQVNMTQEERLARIAAREKRRKVMKMRRIRAAIVFSLIILFILFEIIIHLPLFDIDKISVKGNTNVSNEDIIKISKIKKGDGLYSLDVEELSARVSKLPRIESCEIEKDYPSRVIVKVKERAPLIYLPYKDKNIIVDKDGICIDVVDNAPRLTFLDGMKGIKYSKGKVVRVKDDKNMKSVLKIVDLSVKKKLFFKKVVFVKGRVRLYALDELYVVGTRDEIMKSLKNGSLSSAMYKIYESEIDKGELNIGVDNDFILSQ